MRPRLSVGQLGIVGGVAAMTCGALFAAHSDWTWLLFAAYPLLLLTRQGRPMARWCPIVIALAVVALSAGGARDFVDFMVVGVASFFILLISPLLAWQRNWRRDGRVHRPALFVAAASVALMVSVVATKWPLRLAFLASHRDFEAFAARLEAGYIMSRPQRVGRFLILKAELNEGRPCLWVDTNPSGFDGFVRNPPRGPDSFLQGSRNTCFNLSSSVHLDDDWAFISED
jgi:hypothetical protein